MLRFNLKLIIALHLWPPNTAVAVALQNNKSQLLFTVTYVVPSVFLKYNPLWSQGENVGDFISINSSLRTEITTLLPDPPTPNPTKKEPCKDFTNPGQEFSPWF